MKIAKYLLVVAIILSISSMRTGDAFIPENQLIFQTNLLSDNRVKVGTEIKVAIVIKNYLNITMNDVQVSLNFTESERSEKLNFTNCDFGILQNQNVTLNETIQSSHDEFFTPHNITSGYMDGKYLEFNVTNMINGSRFLFYFNITADESGTHYLPKVKLIYYDNWGDKQTFSSYREIALFFLPLDDPWSKDLPRWNIGKEWDIKINILLFYLSPIIIAILTTTVLSFRRNKV